MYCLIVALRPVAFIGCRIRKWQHEQKYKVCKMLSICRAAIGLHSFSPYLLFSPSTRETYASKPISIARHRHGPAFKTGLEMIRAFVLYLSTLNCFIHSFSW
ncbi:MAG: hypothetical protein ACJAVO_002247 [Parvibaculaceae bacterium]|jgi:hypothetical protein